MSWKAETPFNDLPLLPPELERIETHRVLKACITARAAIAELKTAGELIPDQGLLINILPLMEAKDSSRNDIVYTPPMGETVIRDLMANWERFIHGEDDLDPLVKMAISHYQFECVHPFPDGNGRTGRILNILYLIQPELLSLPILYLSRFILERRDDYYSLLQAVTAEEDWESWILFMLEAVENTARWTTKKSP